MITHIAHLLIRHHRVVDAQNHVTLLQPSLSCRHISIGFINHHAIQFLVLSDKSADTGILTREHHSQVLRLVLSIIFRIRIQPAKHSRDTRTDGFLRVQGVHIEQFQVLIHVIKDIEMLRHLKVVVVRFLSLCRHRNNHHHQNGYDMSSHNFLKLINTAAKLHDYLKKTFFFPPFLQKI